MTDQDLKKLNRRELLELLLKQSTEIQSLQEQLRRSEAALADRRLRIDQAGSIAEASLQLNGIFEAAQAACQQYTENIQQLSQRQEELCARMDRESRERAAAIVAEAEEKSRQLEQETQTHCQQLLAQAEAESQAYWDEVSAKLQAFSDEHAELQRLLSVVAPRKGGA